MASKNQLENYSRKLLAFTVLSLNCLFSTPTLATDVFLQLPDDSFGQGTLIRSGNECLIITPKHVLIDETGMPRGGPVKVIYSDRSESKADLHKVFGEDLSLLKLQEQPVSGCNTTPFETQSVDRILAGSTQAVLEIMSSDGASNYTHMAIVQQDVYGDIQLTPMHDTGSIEKGFSGGAIYVNNKPVGMLTNIDKGIGHAIRSDAIMATLSTFLAAALNNKTLFLNLNDNSRFLKQRLNQQAASKGIPMAEAADTAARSLHITTQIHRVNDETGAIVRFESLIRVIDSLGRELTSRRIEAAGNSFINMEKAVENGHTNLLEAFENADLLDQLP